MGEVNVDFVAFDKDGTCRMVLVEEGPWSPNISAHLSQVQDRIFGCLDAALDGQLAETFPQSIGKTIVIQVDCYDLPVVEVDDFIRRFSDGVGALADYSVDRSPYVEAYRIEANHESLPPT